MKKLAGIIFLFLIASLVPLSLNAQAYVKPVGKALVKTTAENAIEVPAKDILKATTTAAKNTAKIAVPIAAMDTKATIPAGISPLTPNVAIANGGNAGLSSLKENVSQSVARAESHQNFAENVLGQQVFDELTAFVSDQQRFPEQHFGDDFKDLPPVEALSFYQESSLRTNIDLLLANAPDNVWSKKVLALKEELSERVLNNISLTFTENAALAHQFQGNIPTKFTTPIALQSAEMPNAYQLTENFYRGAQPTEQGYKMLADRGVKTIISFRTHKPNKQLIESLGMKSVHIPLNPALITSAQMTEFLKLVSDPEHQPVYVHCRHGSDRTGTMVAMYRMVIQKWSKKQALEELKNPQFGYHKIFFTLPSHIKMVNTTRLSGKLQK